MIVLTGYPGFLGKRLVQLLIGRSPEVPIRLLVQAKFKAQADDELRGLPHRDIAAIVGDITLPDLGLGDAAARLAAEVTHIWHLAAVYDLSIGRDIARRINVEGTRNVLDFAERCPKLVRLLYVSTAYVSGLRQGVVLEDELDHTAGFKNFYEETKYLAEVDVRRRMRRIPTTIFRPSVVIGDSRTGETQKFDGPYFVLKFIRRLPSTSPMVRIGDGKKPVNVVPVDYVVAAMDYLATAPTSEGRTYHLADPAPLVVNRMVEVFASALRKKLFYIPVPAKLARAIMATPAGKLLGLSPELIDYFDFGVTYDCRNVLADLKGSGISCPSLETYAVTMVSFMERHLRDVSSSAMY